MTTTRFAPSPTGYLHLGHAFAALTAYHVAEKFGGDFLLRIEDIDRGRCREEFVDAVVEDLSWLGLGWEEPVRRQSEHMDDYITARRRLHHLTYPCFCTRKQIRDEIAAAGHAPHASPGDTIYPGTCRNLSDDERARRIADGEQYAERLNIKAAVDLAGKLTWRETGGVKIKTVHADPQRFGDVVIARKDLPTSYHLAVTVDDHLQGITMVTRAADLAPATDIHRLLQALLGFSPPDYFHHPLITDPAGRRLAKRDHAMTIRGLREAGYSAKAVIELAMQPPL